jgi:cytidine deaminase
MTNQELIDVAMPLRDDIKRSELVHTGGVSCALETEEGQVITGVCLDASCGIGFCAEHSAIAEMGKGKTMRIMKIVAVNWDGTVLAPCGRCRELIMEVDPRNADTRVILAADKDVPVSELLPMHWATPA